MKQQQVGTIVGSSVHLTGAIKDTSDITIFGGVDGEISSEQKVIIEESAIVKGPINAAEVIVSGRINGTITAKQRIELNPSGSIKGNIDTGELLIHSGATFIGKCNMPERTTGEDGISVEDEPNSQNKDDVSATKDEDEEEEE